MSRCNGASAQNWPPVKGPATASGVTGTFRTIKHSEGSVQTTSGAAPAGSSASGSGGGGY